MVSDEGRKVTLKSSDGEEFLVEETVAMESQTIRHMIEDGCADSGIPLPNVNSKILSKVIEYCKKHIESVDKPSVAAGGDEKAAEEDLKGWDSDFVMVDQATLSDLILGLVLRIKLPLMKHKLSVTAANTNTEPCCSYEAVAVTNIIRPSSAGEEASCFKQ